jgi:saposin
MDSYATLLFSKITEIKPEEFCKQYGLCRDTALFSGVRSDSTCVFCHHLLDEIMSKLKDPDAEVIDLRCLYMFPTHPDSAFLGLNFLLSVV